MKIGILTGGGDCPGLNAVIRGVVKTAIKNNIQVYGIVDGFKGLVLGNIKQLDLDEVRGILHKGGTILGTSNRDNPFNYGMTVDGKIEYKDMSHKVIDNIKQYDLDYIVVVGGDGTLNIAHELSNMGVRVIGVPKTIDNDISATDLTFGFETAVETATEAIDKLHTTAESHHRVMIVEVMGRDAGYIALYSGIAGGADIILIPEIPFTYEGIAKKIQSRKESGRDFSVVVVAEGAKMPDGYQVIAGENKGNLYNKQRLGGIGESLRDQLSDRYGYDVRTTVLGHVQRGGSPCAFDRILSSRYGYAAVKAILEDKSNVMVSFVDDKIITVPLVEGISCQKKVDRLGELVVVAKGVGISFGEDL